MIGINGCGRMGKLLLRRFIADGQSKITVNTGRKVGHSIEELVRSILEDSTYGRLEDNLFGSFNEKGLEVLIQGNKVRFNGVEVKFLQIHRNPWDIQWDEDVRLVIDTTGKFNYPTREKGHEKGSVRDHLANSCVEKVIVSSPFNLTEGSQMPVDVKTIVMGVNDGEYKPGSHHLISNASCSTNCLAHLLNPLVREIGAQNIEIISVLIPHAKTVKQPGLDRLPGADQDDPCTFRSSKNNMFISTTGAAKTLPLVINGLDQVAFSADSIRVDLETGSLVGVHILFRHHEELKGDLLKRVYGKHQSPFSKWTSSRVCGSDIIKSPYAAIIDGSNNDHWVIDKKPKGEIRQMLKLYAWFDNEWGYVRMMHELSRMVMAKM